MIKEILHVTTSSTAAGFVLTTRYGPWSLALMCVSPLRSSFWRNLSEILMHMGSMGTEEWFPAVLGVLNSKASFLTLVESNGQATPVRAFLPPFPFFPSYAR